MNNSKVMNLDLLGKELAEFSKKTQHIELMLHEVWSAGNIHVDADCEVRIDYKIGDIRLAYNVLKEELSKKPYIESNSVSAFYENTLKRIIEYDFEEYVTEDTYYPPVAEDYDCNLSYVLADVCRKYHLDLISFRCVGETSGYIPN